MGGTAINIVVPTPKKAAIADGGVIEECGHWVFEEKPDFIAQQLTQFWSQHG